MKVTNPHISMELTTEVVQQLQDTVTDPLSDERPNNRLHPTVRCAARR